MGERSQLGRSQTRMTRICGNRTLYRNIISSKRKRERESFGRLSDRGLDWVREGRRTAKVQMPKGVHDFVRKWLEIQSRWLDPGGPHSGAPSCLVLARFLPRHTASHSSLAKGTRLEGTRRQTTSLSSGSDESIEPG